jgi:hypothetical protein
VCLQIIADAGGSIKDIYHNRSIPDTDISSVRVTCVVETADRENAQLLYDTLVDAGYEVDMPRLTKVGKAISATITGYPTTKDVSTSPPVE